MPTDDERREVARRLRMSRSEWSGMGWKLWLGPKFGAVVLSDGNRDELEDAAHRLADLIEPSCDRDTPQKVAEEMFGKMRHSTKEEADAYDAMLKSKSVEIRPVDRDALLALAAEMAADSVRSAKQGSSVSPVYILHAARNIAEACGETFGSIRNRELAKWGTSIVPKETIVDRDALLKLARYMDKDVAETEAHFSNVISTKSVSDYARRIREACGEGER